MDQLPPDRHGHMEPDGLESDLSRLMAQLSRGKGVARQAAREGLVRLGWRALPALIEALGGGDHHLRWEAAKALQEINLPEAAPTLAEALRDEHFDVRWLAAEGLIRLGEPALRPLLEELYRHPKSYLLHEGAAHVLRSLDKEGKAPGTKEVLQAVVGSAPEVTAAEAARAALDRLGPE